MASWLVEGDQSATSRKRVTDDPSTVETAGCPGRWVKLESGTNYLAYRKRGVTQNRVTFYLIHDESVIRINVRIWPTLVSWEIRNIRKDETWGKQ